MKFFGLAWFTYLVCIWLIDLPFLQYNPFKQTLQRSQAIAQSVSTTYSIAFFLPGCGWFPDPACLSRSTTRSSTPSSTQTSSGRRASALSSTSHSSFSRPFYTYPGQPERSAAAPANAPIPALNNSLQNVYSRLAPWVRGDRPTVNLNELVRLVRVNVDDPNASQSQRNAVLFHTCEVPGAVSTLAQTYAMQAPYQVWIRDRLVLALPEQTAAAGFVQRLRQLLDKPGFEANSLVPRWDNEDLAITAGKEVLLKIDPLMEQTFHHNADLIAIDWTNNLRRALGAEPLSLIDAQIHLYGLVESRSRLRGTASWYGPYFHKRLTANGERFDQHALTVAHKTLEFDTFLKVTNRRNGESVIVRVNDRGPYVEERSLDLSYQAARCISSDEAGVVAYDATIMAPGLPDTMQLASPSTAETSSHRIAGLGWKQPPID